MARTARKRIGRNTLSFADRPVIVATASVAGPDEAKGPLGAEFDEVKKDSILGLKSWEKAEAQLLTEVITMAMGKANVDQSQVDLLAAGDLLNQIISADFSAREFSIPFLGLFGACSTMAESLIVAAMAVDGGYADWVVAATSSHFDTAERQFRYPIEHGTQRHPTTQWTATGAGAALVASAGEGPVITAATIGTVIDYNQKNINDMGSAMAPAAADTIARHLQGTGRRPEDYDLIATGDLAAVGRPIAADMLKEKGFDLGDRFNDCGVMLYDLKKQDVHAGGSGCACSALVYCGHIHRLLQRGEYRRVLLVGTGALFSPTSSQQGESIPGIAHAVEIEAGGPSS
ncbi:MAG: stage V sporulation protein AD [Bacillota bacterium]